MIRPTENVEFTLSHWGVQLLDDGPVGIVGYKYLHTLVADTGEAYRMLSFTRRPTLKLGGKRVTLNTGDRIKGLATISETYQGKLLTLVYHMCELV